MFGQYEFLSDKNNLSEQTNFNVIEARVLKRLKMSKCKQRVN